MKTLSIVIPVFNEEARLGECLRALRTERINKGVILEQIIFVDDGSTDHSMRRILRSKNVIERNLSTHIRIANYGGNRGKGYAVKMGMRLSDSDYTLFMDADMATPLSELTKFVHMMNKDIDVIVGTRKNGHSTVLVHQPKYRELMGKVFTFLSNVILNTWVTDFTCGFKAFSRHAKNQIFPKVTCDRWGFDSEALFLARRNELSIAETAVVWTDKKGSKVDVLRDAPISLLELILIRIRHATRANTSIGAKYRYHI